MKKILSVLMMGLMLISMMSVAFAAVDNVADDVPEADDIDEETHADDILLTGNQNVKEPKAIKPIAAEREEDETEEIEVETEDEPKVERVREMKRVNFGNEEEIDSEVEIEIDGEGKVKAKLSNGNVREVKVMPSTASENAIAALRLHNCVEAEGCVIEFKEVGEGEETEAVYEVKTQKKAKFLGMFDVEMDVSAEVSAEDGKVRNIKRPWWSFMAKEYVEEVETEVVETEEEAEPLTGMPPADLEAPTLGSEDTFDIADETEDEQDEIAPDVTMDEAPLAR